MFYSTWGRMYSEEIILFGGFQASCVEQRWECGSSFVFISREKFSKLQGWFTKCFNDEALSLFTEFLFFCLPSSLGQRSLKWLNLPNTWCHFHAACKETVALQYLSFPQPLLRKCPFLRAGKGCWGIPVTTGLLNHSPWCSGGSHVVDLGRERRGRDNEDVCEDRGELVRNVRWCVQTQELTKSVSHPPLWVLPSL